MRDERKSDRCFWERFTNSSGRATDKTVSLFSLESSGSVGDPRTAVAVLLEVQPVIRMTQASSAENVDPR